MLVPVDEELRAGDADRERAAERLRSALDEGRLNLDEYDDRLREAYQAKTYADLDKLFVDLPSPAPVERSALATPHQQRTGNPVPAWLAVTWGPWAQAVGICVTIWFGIAIFSGFD